MPGLYLHDVSTSIQTVRHEFQSTLCRGLRGQPPPPSYNSAHTQNRAISSTSTKRFRQDIGALQNHDVKASFEKAVTKIAATHSTPANVDDANTQITECLQQAAAESQIQIQAYLTSTSESYDPRNNRWARTTSSQMRFGRYTGDIRKRSRQLRNDFYDNETSQINMNAVNHQIDRIDG